VLLSLGVLGRVGRSVGADLKHQLACQAELATCRKLASCEERPSVLDIDPCFAPPLLDTVAVTALRRPATALSQQI
jgi:hypothetical protein